MAKDTITPNMFLDRKERKQLLKACNEKEILDKIKGRKTWVVRFMLVHLAMYSGLRVAEIAALKIGDIHLDKKEPYIYVRQGKGGKDRAVYIENALPDHLREFIKSKPRYGHSTDPEAPLFVGAGGGHMQRGALQKSFKQALKAAGLPDTYSIHSCRHTFAVYLTSDSQDLRFVKQQLGHSSLAVTSLYAHADPDANGRLAAMMKPWDED